MMTNLLTLMILLECLMLYVRYNAILILVCPHGQFLLKLTRCPRVYSRGQNQWTKNLIFSYRLLWIKVPSASWLELKTANP